MELSTLGLLALAAAMLVIGIVCFYMHSYISRISARVSRIDSQHLRPRDVYRIMQDNRLPGEKDQDQESVADESSGSNQIDVIESAVGSLLESAIGGGNVPNNEATESKAPVDTPPQHQPEQEPQQEPQPQQQKEPQISTDYDSDASHVSESVRPRRRRGKKNE